MKFEIFINNEWVDFSSFLSVPFDITLRQDEGFDSASLSLIKTDIEEPFKPFTKTKLTLDDKVFRFYISNPSVVRKVQGENPTYNHNLGLIEPTKHLERVYADTTLVTQKVRGLYGGGYDSANITTSGFMFEQGIITSINYTLSTPLFAGDTLIVEYGNNIVTWSRPPASYLRCTISSNLGSLIEGQAVTLNNIGNFYIEYNLIFNVGGQEVSGVIRYDFEVMDSIPESPIKTISQELKRVVKTAKPLRSEIDTQEYYIDPIILDKYKDEICPEFSQTRKTLWEKMLEFGQYIHAIPRVISDENENWNIITFDFLGGQEKAINNSTENYLENKHSIEEWASDLDTQISNIVNTDNIDEGSIIEPANNIYRTVRAESGATEVAVDNALFMTSKPIAKLIAVKVRLGNQEADITKYIYESFEYSVLSSYNGFYPYSKAYALLYTLGKPNITKLQHKNEDLISPAFKEFAIINILRKEGFSISSNDIINLQYQIEYIPIIDARAKQKKLNQDTFDIESTLVYNQSTNSVNSRAYGENIKGAVLRYGNEEPIKNYYCKNITEMPNLGTVHNDYYVNVLNIQVLNDLYKYKYSIEYSKDFNRLSGFVGVNSNVRMYEVSERQVFERTIYYGSNITVGKFDLNKQSDKTMIWLDGVKAIAETFSNSNSDNLDPTMARVLTYDKDENLIKELGLELTTLGFGNSLLFLFKFQDNYSAGEKAIRGVSSVPNKLIQDYVPYSDPWGAVEYLHFELTTPSGSANNETTGDALPELKDIGFAKFVASTRIHANTTVGALKILKDSREHIGVSYQIHFLTNDDDIIIGNGLTNLNRLVRQNQQEPIKAYAFNRKVGKFEKTIDLTDATLIKTFSNINIDFEIPSDLGELTNPYFAINPFETTIDCESVVFVNENNDLVMAVNKKLTNGQSIEKIYFNLN